MNTYPRVVPIQIPVSKILLVTLKTLVSLSTSTPVCALISYHTTLFMSGKRRYPATSELAQLVLTNITYMKSIFLCRSKTILRKLSCPASGNYFFLRAMKKNIKSQQS